MIVELGNGLKVTDAYIRIEKYRCVLSSRACRLLSWSRYEPHIVVVKDTDTGILYIRHSRQRHGFLARKKNGRGFINSRELSRTLTDTLGTLGSYRICEDDYIFIDGCAHYRIDTTPYRQE